jgi:2-polyprenyl-3-methyl-5-hydroxy-6-metoxy-1,4-benzoquinol methylase
MVAGNVWKASGARPMNLLDSKRFMRGEEFSDGLDLLVTIDPQAIVSRIDMVTRLCAGKRVVHVGCADHVPLIREKLENGTWLHDRLVQVASRCVGVDINQEGIDYMQRLGYQDVHCADLTDDNSPLGFEGEFDYVVLGEVIEHVSDPTAFLEKVRQRFAGRASRIIVTAPNAFRLENIRFAFANREAINSDHRYWFTPYTLSKSAAMAGIDVERIGFCQGTHNNRSWAKRAFYQHFQMLAYGIYLIGTF